MSVQDQREVIELPNHGDMAFSALMDALAPEETEATGGAQDPAGAAAPATGAGTGGVGDTGAAVGDGAPAGRVPAPAGPAADAGDGVHPPAPAGVQGQPGEPAAGHPEQPPATGQPAAPAETGAAPDVVITQLGTLSTAIEENLTKAFQQQAYEQARTDYEKYFEALEKHPRLLVGTQVPAIGKEGMETLRDSNDAKEWQEAVRGLLVEEIKAEANSKLEENAVFMETIHASIDLFKNNPDLIPGAKGFNKALADQFATMMAPYEVRVEGKLQGYSIPVQPIINGLRKSATPPPPPPVAASPPAPTQRRVDPPQAGITSKAGSSSEKEDFSTLFGTIGLPHLQI